MSLRVLEPNEIAKWTSNDSDDPGSPEFERGPCLGPEAGRGQIVLGQDGPTLWASSGNCLVIVVVVVEEKLGMIIHLGRDHSLREPDERFVEKPFQEYPKLKDSPKVRFLSSDELKLNYGQQIVDLHRVFSRCTKDASFDDIFVASCGVGEISAELKLNTLGAVLRVIDDFGAEQEWSFSSL